jgi:oxygen-independent coproporphyrinogen-3 oxidase
MRPVDSDRARPQATTDLLARYGGPGPRYTSYPTAPNWSDDWSSTDFGESLSDYGAKVEAGQELPLSLYVHIPFCEARCHFCGCNVVLDPRHQLDENYIELLAREIGLVRQHMVRPGQLLQVHLGGGTPTHLSPAQLDDLMQTIAEALEVDPDCEYSVEVDPAVTTPEQLELLRARGFDRISIGVQDLDPKVQEAVGRVFGVDELELFLERCRVEAFESINFDLIYGLPHQNVDSMRRTLEHVVRFRPDRLAVFQYAHVPWMKPHQNRMDATALPDANTRRDLRELITKLLLGADYVEIGMDHFALPEDRLAIAQREGWLRRNFMGYAALPPTRVLGIGLSSISELDSAYSQNLTALPRYRKALMDGQLPVQRGCSLNAEDRLRREVIMGIMTRFELDTAAVAERFQIDFRSHFRRELALLVPMVQDGLVHWDANRLVVDAPGREFVRRIAMLFDESLAQGVARGTQRFSETV